MNQMPNLSGDLRQAILWKIQEVQREINLIEELLCLSEEEEKENERT
jgi:hypothetical protein